MLMHKQAHGSGVDLDSSDANQIDAATVSFDAGHMVQVYRGGNYATATTCVCVPDWNRNAENLEAREEKNHSGAALGQTESSARQELTAWIFVLSMPMRSMYAIDSAHMLTKAKMLLKAVKLREEMEAHGKKAPFAESLEGNMGAPAGWKPSGASMKSSFEKESLEP